MTFTTIIKHGLLSTLIGTLIGLPGVLNAHEAPPVSQNEAPLPDLSATPYLLVSPDKSLSFKILTYSGTGSDSLAVAELSVPKGTVSPRHTHSSTEWVYLLEGQFSHHIHGKWEHYKPGQIATVPANTQVIHKVKGEKTSKLLVIWQPASEVDSYVRAGFEIKPLE